MAAVPLAYSELATFQQLTGGQRATPINASLEGKHVAIVVRTGESSEVIFSDVFNRNYSFRRQVAANEIAIHPTKPHVALYSSNRVQVFDIENQARIVTVNFESTPLFWRFVDENNIILVSDKSVYRWNYTAPNSEPKKVFDRHANLLGKKIVDAGMDKKEEYLYILGQSPKEDGDVHSQIQLFSTDRSATQVIEAYQISFASFTVGSNAKPSTLLVIENRVRGGGNLGKINVVEVSAGGSEVFQKKAVDIPFNDPNDYPVALLVSEKFGLVHMLTKCNNIFSYELETMMPVYHSVIQLSAPALLVSAVDAIGGYVILTQDYNLVAISINDVYRARIAQRCEKSQQYMHALELYDNVHDIKRVLTHITNFDNDKVVDFCGKLSAEDCFECIEELVRSGGPERIQLAALLSTKYSQFLSSDKIIKLFEDYRQYGALYFYLQSTINHSTDPEIHFKYIQAAIRHKQIKEAERICRESSYYDPSQVITFLKEAHLQTHIPLIIVCDKHDRIKELIEFLYREKAMSSIEILATQVNPKRLPAIVSALFDLDCSDDLIKRLINSMRRDFDIDELVEACVLRNRLRLLQGWLETRIQNGALDTPTHNALAKVYIEGHPAIERYLKEDKYYDAVIIGEYCEKRNPQLAFIAYEREKLDDKIIKLCYDNALFKLLVRYLLSRGDADLWERVLNEDDGNRRKLIDHIVQFIQVEHQTPEDISVMVKAFITAGLSQGLLDVLEKLIITGGSYREHRNLQTLMVVTGIREAPSRVMGYINVLDNYDAPAIAELAITHGLFEEAFEIFRRFEVDDRAVTVLIEHFKDYKRAYDFAEGVNKSEVWAALGLAQLRSNQVAEGVESLIRANYDSAVMEVVEKCSFDGLYSVLVKYLQMARKTSKDPVIDTELCYAIAKTKKLRDLDELLGAPNRVDVAIVGDRCYDDEMYEAAKVIFFYASNFSKCALTLVKLGEWQNAVDAARKANCVRTWKVVCFACVEHKEFNLAMTCGLQIVTHAEEIQELVDFYQDRGYYNELMHLLETALSSERTHVAMFTELAILYTKHKPDKLREYLEMYWSRMNMRKLLIACEAAHLWSDLVFLYDKNEDFENAAVTMMKHPAAWKESLFKEVIVKVGNVEIFFQAAEFYLDYHPMLLNDVLIALSSRLDHSRLVNYFIKVDQLPLIETYLRHVQPVNNKLVNENLNQLLIENEDYKGLRESIDVYNNFDNVALAQQLESHELLQFRRISAYLYRRNNRWKTSIELCKKDKLYVDAIDFASDSRNNDVANELLTYFIENELQDCFSTMLYKCFDLLKPDYVMELAWKYGVTDYAMPYYIQVMKNMNTRMERLEVQVGELKTKEAKPEQVDMFVPPVSTSVMGDRMMAIGYQPHYSSFA